MRLLLVGAKGQLGREISSHGEILKNHSLTCLSHETLNIVDRDEVLRVYLHYQPDLVINAAAYTKVDLAEKETIAAYAVNTQGVANLAQACEKFHIPLIHFSTDYVFDGEKKTPYTEEDDASALNIYGDSKYKGEALVRQYCAQHIILRVSSVFGIYGHNFLKTILRLAKEKTEIKIIADQYSCPTPAFSIANAVYSIIQKITQNTDFWGTYHFCGTPCVSWYAFAEAIIRAAANFEALTVQNVCPIPASEYPTPAKRPQNAILSCEKIIATLDIFPSNWIEILPNLIKEHYETPQT